MKKLLTLLLLNTFLLITQLHGAKEVSLENKITSLYVSFFNRAPDYAGLSYWNTTGTNVVNAGGTALSTLKQLSAGFASHPTFTSTYNSMDDETFVNAIYNNALGRDGDEGGINYWKDLLSSGKSRSDMVAEFMEISLTADLDNDPQYASLSAADKAAAQERQDLITNKVEAAVYFTNTLGEKTNLDGATDAMDPASLANDAAYLASQKVIADLGLTQGSVYTFIGKIATISGLDDAIEQINQSWDNITAQKKSLEKKFQIVKTQEKLNEIYQTFEANATQEIDFSQNNAIVVTSGSQFDKDASIEITSIKEEDIYYSISVETTILAENCPKETESQIPYDIKSFPINYNRKVIFQENINIIECSNDSLEDTPTTLSFREVDVENELAAEDGNTSQFLEVIQNETPYEEIFYNNKIAAIEELSEYAAQLIHPEIFDDELPYVDFQNETLIAIVLALHSTNGYDVKVTSIKEYSNHIEVEVQRDMVGRYCGAGASLTFPTAFIAIEKTHKEIVFREIVNYEHCEPLTVPSFP